MMRMRSMVAIPVVVLAVGLAGCSDSDDAGSLTLGDEEVALGAGLCVLEEQEDDWGGGTIELTGEAWGINAAGDDVLVKFTRYSSDSALAGDTVSVLVGDDLPPDPHWQPPGDWTQFSAETETGAISIDGSVLSVRGLELSGDDGSDVTVSFEIVC